MTQPATTPFTQTDANMREEIASQSANNVKAKFSAKPSKAPPPRAQVIQQGLRSRVKWFNDAKGYGFLLPVALSEDKEIFVHYKQIRKEAGERACLKEGELVEFDLVRHAKGYQAEDVEREKYLNESAG